MLALTYLAMAILGPLRSPRPIRSSSWRATWPRWGCCCAWARGADPEDPAVFTAFYMRVWKLFFLEYALVAAACLAG